MKLPKKLLPGDTVAIVSLSSGILGEKFAKHQLNIAETRLKNIFKLKTKYMDNSLKGVDYISAHPEARADDLKQAMYDDEVKAILVATGGDDTFKIIPYLLEDKDFVEAVKTKPKIFLGFSDTTNNHLMFYRLGMPTFYGVDFLSDFGEMDTNMLPYTEKSISDIFFGNRKKIEIQSSPVWYLKRVKYTEDQVGLSRSKVVEEHGYESILGSSPVERVAGRLFGGCVESLYEMVAGNRYKEQPTITKKYELFPKWHEWNDKVLFIETSEAQSPPDKLHTMLQTLGSYINYGDLRGIIIGKPQDNVYYTEYCHLWQKLANKYDIPILYNVNFGHSYPHCILPYDATVEVDFANKKILILSTLFSD